MPDNIVPFPAPTAPEPEPVPVRRSRLIVSVGRRRFAFDFTNSVTELPDSPGSVLPIGPDKSTKDYGVPKNEPMLAQPSQFGTFEVGKPCVFSRGIPKVSTTF